MPFPFVVVPPDESESERWSCPDYRLLVRVLLHTDLFKGCGCVSLEELDKLFRPLLTCVVLCEFALTSIETLLT
jgi:hypothetical protein